ncbi:MAG: GxxExxY protein [Akkermansiaceae bacterium]
MSKPETKYDLTGQVIGCAMVVHRKLSHGFNENVYKNSLAIELRKKGFGCVVEKKIKVFYKGFVVGDFSADIVVNDVLIIELKAVTNLLPAHEAQLVNYLTATDSEEGLLLNFGAPSLQYKKKFKDFKPKSTEPPILQS